MLIAGIILIVFVAAAVLFSWLAYRLAFYSPGENRQAIPATDGPEYDPHREMMARIYHQLQNRSFEEVSITSVDGLTLYGRYYHVKDGAPVCIGFHGYRSSAMTDFSGGSELSQAMGQNLLLVDERAHGRSQGSTITFGIRERYDCLLWAEYVVNRFGPDTKILLYGMSMGAATVLMASNLPLPEQVKGIVADCPYASAKEIICKVGKNLHLPSKLAYPFVALGARLFGGFHLDEIDAIRAVRNAKIPILIFHGEADNFVPHGMSLSVYHANPALVQRHTFPGAAHGISYLVDPPRYRRILENFAARVLEKA